MPEKLRREKCSLAQQQHSLKNITGAHRREKNPFDRWMKQDRLQNARKVAP